MGILLRLICFFLLLMVTNVVFVVNYFDLSGIAGALIINGAALFYFLYSINPNPAPPNKHPQRIKVLADGYTILTVGVLMVMSEPLVYIYAAYFSKRGAGYKVPVLNGIVFIILVFLIMCNGLIRITFTSKQLGLIKRLLLFFTWWVPLVNLIVLINCLTVVRREYQFEIAKEELNLTRKDTEICKTRYPVLLVHGIFWRDWQVFNYWGRIPKELTRNGATVFYGNHQSAADMETGANELKNQILNIIETEGCEKVNIIAHSKGGLDARRAISYPETEGKVASLTTVCTPHSGSELVDTLLKFFSEKTLRIIAKKYNTLYKKLGDREPDFLSGVYDLTTERCTRFNREVPNVPGVLYQSITAKMSAVSGAGFPLNAGYVILRRTQKENDGFVSADSSHWGNYLGCCETKGRSGISHGDMIDLTRKNIPGFDVCECYVNILKDLKSRGC